MRVEVSSVSGGRALVGLIALIVSFGASRAAAQAPDPTLVWHTLQTPHFEITYHDPLGAIAQHLAAAAERANEKLSRALGFRASQRVLILLTDETDDANGIANVLPRDQLHLFASAPDDLSPIADYDDWIATLVTHEHTHILHMDQIGGLPALVNVLLGKSVAPNSIQPRWFIEGIATYEESKQTSGGRGRSTIFDMMLRADVLEERWLPLDAISNDPVRWPHGDIRYLYGSRFLTFIAERYGDAALTRMGLDYGRQAIPYGLNRIAKRATGFTFTELYEQFHAALRERYGAQRDAIVQAGVVEGRALTAHADLARSPRFLRDGRLVFYRSDGHSPEGVYVLDGTRITRLTRSSGEASVAVHPDGRSLVFSQNGPYRDIYSFHDLFRFDLTSGELERLTTGLRASQPDVSPNGREVVFVTQKNGGSRLELAALDDVEGSRRPLSCGEDCEQVYTPRFSPDGKTVAVSAWRRGGYRDVLLIDRASGLVRELTHDRAQDTGPVFSPDGKRVYFSSDRTGVANLYAFELDSGQTAQLSNVVMGAYQPQVSPDGTKLVYVGYASHGFGLHELALSDVTPRTAEPYRNERPAQDVVVEHAPVPVEDYDPTRTLPPNNYQLDLQRAALGYELGIHIAGSDIAGFHRYRVLITSTFDPVEAGVSVHYAYGRSPLAPTLHVFRTIAARSDLKVGGKPRRWIAENVGASAGVSYTFPSFLRSQSLQLDYSLVHVGKERRFGGELDPNDPPPELPVLGYTPSAGFGYAYSDVTGEAYDIGPSRGRNFGVRVDASDPIMGRNIRSVSLRLYGRQFVKMPWLEGHVFALNYEGGFAGGDGGRIGVFSIGGFPEDSALPSIYDIAVFGNIPSLGGDALRGYPQGIRSGTQFQLVQLEYRFPLFDPGVGIATLPVFLRRLYADVFSDVGNAWNDRIRPSDLLVGVGGELFANIEISYRLFFNLRLGVARGVNDGGETQVYMHLGSPF